MKPSSLYRAKFWTFGLWAARHLSLSTATRLAKFFGKVYWKLAKHRREIVIENILPCVAEDRAVAEKLCQQLFQNFVQKLFDLWRYEGGTAIDDLFCELTGWDIFLEAQRKNRGVLILTPHLGNWEFGAPVLAKKGQKLLVITLEEPDGELTQMRQAARARWGIETLVIGNNPFAFVEIIRRLEAGASVALLVDRPPASSAVSVNLFGKPFSASMAGAELARASGCVLLPVYLPRLKTGYAGHILPEISYDRASLRSPKARCELTQKIMDVFEKPIQEHLDQWYHFVPLWSK
ncbi:MAG: lysophospholipid acyltransferase family protein [Verrucomicrobiota bacterium]